MATSKNGKKSTGEEKPAMSPDDFPIVGIGAWMPSPNF